MKKQILSCILAAMLLMLSACGEASSEPNTADMSGNGSGSGTEETVEDTEQSQEEIPETEDPAEVWDEPAQDFEGRALNVLCTNWYNIDSNWTSPELQVTEMTGETMNDAVYERNANIEAKFNVKMNFIDGGAHLSSTIETDYIAGTQGYDIAYPRISEMNDLAGAGTVYNLNKIESLELSKAWWSQFARESLTVNDSIFFVSGDMNFMDKWTSIGVFFNKDVAASYNITSDQLYDLVEEGKWTYDVFRTYTSDITNDSNGDGTLDAEDTWGCTANQDYINNVLHFWDSPFLVTDDSGKLVFNLNNEATFDAIDRMIDMLKNNVIIPNSCDIAEPVFTSGRSLFYIEVAQKLANFRDSDTDFGILPPMKYDENQENYRTTCATLSQMICIPKTTPDKEYAGLMLNAMGYESSQTIAPAYIENALESKFARDERTADMLNIIFDGITYDLGYHTDMSGLSGIITSMRTSLENTAASKFQAITKGLDKNLEKINGYYTDAE